MAIDPQDLIRLQELASMLEAGDFYAIFEIPRDFERKQLRKSYYALSRRFHPDRFYRQEVDGQEELIELVFAGINRAYRTLDDPTERVRYDRELRFSEIPEPPKAPKGMERELEKARKARDEAQRLRDEKRAAQEAERAAKAAEHDATAHRVRFDKAKKPGSTRTPPPDPRKAKKKKKTKRPGKRAPESVSRLKEQLKERLKQARRYARVGARHGEAGDWVKASSAWYLATQYDPRNDEYKEHHAEAEKHARVDRVARLIREAERAESLANRAEALAAYRKAVELEPPQGEPYYRLGRMLYSQNAEDRDAMDMARAAVTRDPTNPDYRMLLGEIYEEKGMTRNANRQYKEVLTMRPSDDSAKEAVKRTRT